MAVTRITIIKIIELALAITCLVLHYHSLQASDQHGLVVTTSTFGGYIIILVGVFAGVVTGEPLGRKIDIFFSLVGCALFIVSGVLSINYFQGWSTYKETSNYGLAKGSIAIINGAIFLIDAIFSFRA